MDVYNLSNERHWVHELIVVLKITLVVKWTDQTSNMKQNPLCSIFVRTQLKYIVLLISFSTNTLNYFVACLLIVLSWFKS